jgi:hypothetical protein
MIPRIQDENNAPPSDDHVVKLNIDDDIIFATDKEGNELCRLAFEVEGRLVHFQTPRVNKYAGFVKRLAELSSLLSRYMPNVEMPDDLAEAYNTPLVNDLWLRLSSIAVGQHKKTKEIILDIFFNYLDGRIKGIETDQKEWFCENARIDQLQRVFSACYAVDDLIKKNALFCLQSQLNLQNLEEQNSSLTLVKKQEPPSETSLIKQYSGFEQL